MRGVLADPEELLQVMESEAICQKIIEGRRGEYAAARSEKDSACRESMAPKVKRKRKRVSRASPDSACWVRWDLRLV